MKDRVLGLAKLLHGWSGEELARQMGVPRATLQAFMISNTGATAIRRKLLTTLGVPVGVLLQPDIRFPGAPYWAKIGALYKGTTIEHVDHFRGMCTLEDGRIVLFEDMLHLVVKPGQGPVLIEGPAPLQWQNQPVLFGVTDRVLQAYCLHNPRPKTPHQLVGTLGITEHDLEHVKAKTAGLVHDQCLTKQAGGYVPTTRALGRLKRVASPNRSRLKPLLALLTDTPTPAWRLASQVGLPEWYVVEYLTHQIGVHETGLGFYKGFRNLHKPVKKSSATAIMAAMGRS